MPWVKLTDDWYDDPKIAGLDDHGVALWVLGLTWCARNLTDGEIPARVPRKLVEEPDRAVDQLVAAGLWLCTDCGWTVENYLEYQPSRDEVLEKREREKRRSARRRTTSDQPPRGDRAVDQAVTSPRPPHPVPVPQGELLTSQSGSGTPGPQAVDDRPTLGCVTGLGNRGSGEPVASQDAHEVVSA